MAALEIQEFSKVIEQLQEATNAGSITWSKVNPSTFSWNSHDGGRVTLQQVSRTVTEQRPGIGVRNREVRSFRFEVTNSSGVPQLSVNTADTKEADPILQNLFNVITSGITRKGVDFLKSLLEQGNS
jgi:hypothetical protein